jgi:PDZ domain
MPVKGADNMFRRFLLLAVTALLALVGQAPAQLVLPKVQPLPNQKAQIEQIQKELDRIMKQAGLPNQQKAQIEQLQKEMDRLFQQAGAGLPHPQAQIEQMQKNLRGFQPVVPQQAQQLPLAQQGKTFFGNGMAWGGMKLDKVNKDTQEKLGLPEKEGLIVNGVEPNSAAEKAGVKLNDILVRVGDNGVPGDFDAFSKIVKDQKADGPLDLVVVRDGNEVTLKGAKMPAIVQLGVGDAGIGGGRFGRPGMGGIGIVGGVGGVGRVIKGRNINSTLILNGGARISRTQNGDDFSGEYAKDDLKINVHGKFDNGVAKPAEITVQDGKETKKYTQINDVPQQYHPPLRQIMPAGALVPLLLPTVPNLQNFPVFPMIPGLDR